MEKIMRLRRLTTRFATARRSLALARVAKAVRSR